MTGTYLWWNGQAVRVSDETGGFVDTTRRAHLQGLAGAMGLAAAGQAFAADTRFYGTWTAVVDPGKVPQTMRLLIDAKGAVFQISSFNQGDASFPGGQVTVDGEKIRIGIAPLKLTIEGVLKDDRHMDAVINQGAPVELRFTRGQVADSVSERKWPLLTKDLLEAQRGLAGAPGIGAAWARGARSAILVAGSRSGEAQIPIRTQDQWHWGSIGKSMTATLCARLVDAGVLSWDMTVGQILATEGYSVPEAYSDATLVHLLSHRAGLQRDIGDTGGVVFSQDLADARAERLQYARFALAQKPVGPLGAQHFYSNTSFVVAGAMLEKVTGKSWETLIQREVFRPLGIKRAGQGAPGVRGRIIQPIGHLVTNGKRVPHPPGGPDADNVAAMGPVGRVHMPMADMLVYLSAHRDRPTTFLKAATWDKLHTPPFGANDALGWFTSEDGRLFHTGSNTLWRAEVLVDPRAGFVCATCANDATPETARVVEEVLLSARATALA
ncbi:serine hydrolase [Caulobacter sp. D4A]|uniref:serine hydrolase domain-containing protein n=1 Tax=unclassified Caulobacter TaxID=2648921 RepID=UPI000D72D8B8|nr:MULTISPECIES: serine hydrolase domain-containing protein [unclassified Caulobacter]PXA85740.1 serine hydrolase [Caulobacter sp. D4A]